MQGKVIYPQTTGLLKKCFEMHKEEYKSMLGEIIKSNTPPAHEVKEDDYKSWHDEYCSAMLEKTVIKSNDSVNHPLHYQGEHECIEIMRAMFGDDAVKGFCRCNSFKYRFRAGMKDGNTAEDDIKKAEWYEDYLIEMEKSNA